MGIKPEDLLSDEQNSAEFNGQPVRKGTIGAAIANARIYESTESSAEQKREALEMIKTLAPSIIALELHKFVTWKNADIQAVFDKAGK